MKDIAPDLLEKVQGEFITRYKNNKKLKRLYEAAINGDRDYKTAHAFAIEIGEVLSQCFRKYVTAESLPNRKFYFNIASRILSEPLRQNHDIVSEFCVVIQNNINKSAGLSIKGVKPKFNDDRVKGIVDTAAAAEDFGDVSALFYEQVKSFTQSVVDMAVLANIDAQYEMGLRPRIRRTTAGHCCKWCSNLAGIYDYGDEPKDVFRRHNYCRCLVEYLPGDGGVQNVHTGKWAKEDTIEERKKIGIQGRKLQDRKKKKRMERYS